MEHLKELFVEPQELLDTLHETFKTINERIAALEIVHTRYQGPKGPKGDKGDSGPAGRDGKDSTELNTLREEHNQFRDELDDFRKQVHAYGTSFDAQMREMHRLAVAELADVSAKAVAAVHVVRDEAIASVNRDYSAEVNALREERNEAREELNNFRKELHEFRTAFSTEMHELYERPLADLADVYQREVEAFCAIRDKAWGELKAAAPQGPQGPQGIPGNSGPQGPAGATGPAGSHFSLLIPASACSARVMSSNVAYSSAAHALWPWPSFVLYLPASGRLSNCRASSPRNMSSTNVSMNCSSDIRRVRLARPSLRHFAIAAFTAVNNPECKSRNLLKRHRYIRRG